MKPGDTLWDLARRHETTVDALMSANNLTATSLTPGDMLTLPQGSNVQPETYTVQRGDTLYDIAVAFNLTTDHLIAINNLDGALIRVGQVLRLTPDAGAPAAEALNITVQAGDSLWSIARTHEVSVDAIVSANNLAAGSVIRPGDTLTIPGRYAATSPQGQGGSAPPVITVARGESLWSIARQHNTTVTAIMSANELADTNLRAGQQLRIVPGNELASAAATEPEPRTATPAPAPPSQASMVWPLVGPITSRFGYRRMRLGGSNFHSGLDINGNMGDPIVAATGGTVTFSGWRSGYGNVVIIEAGNHEYHYAHASELLVSAGTQVEVGQLIARVGATGAATGPHLHFEIRVNGQPVDPLTILEAQAARP